MPIMLGIFYGIRDFQYAGDPNFLWMTDIAFDSPNKLLLLLL